MLAILMTWGCPERAAASWPAQADAQVWPCNLAAMVDTRPQLSLYDADEKTIRERSGQMASLAPFPQWMT